MEYPLDFAVETYDEAIALQKRRPSLALLYKAYWQYQLEEGAEIEVQASSGRHWVPVGISDMTNYPLCAFRFKVQHKTPLLPLSDEDQLVGVVAVKLDGCSRHLITDQYTNGVNFTEDWCSYDELQSLYTRLDGSRFEREVL